MQAISFSNTYQSVYSASNQTYSLNTNVALFRNKIINSDCTIDQRNAGNKIIISADGAYYGPDRFFTNIGTGVTPYYTIQQNKISDISLPNIPNSCLLTVNSNISFSDNAKEVSLRYSVEGIYMADCKWGAVGAKTLSFTMWVKSNITGTHSIAFQNANATMSYVTTFTLNSAHTWTKITKTISGPTSGTWFTNSGTGLLIIIDSTCENQKTATLNSWQSANYTCASTYPTTLWKTAKNYLEITGLTLEIGTNPSSREYRPFPMELSLCQRYYETSFPINIAPSNNTTYIAPGSSMFLQGQYGTGFIYFKTTKRSNPKLTFYNPWNSNGNVYNYEKNYSSSNISAQNSNINGFSITSTDTSLQNSNAIFNWTASSEIIEKLLAPTGTVNGWIEEVGGGGVQATVNYFYIYLGNFAAIQSYCIVGRDFYVSSPTSTGITTITSVSNPRPGNSQQAQVNFSPAINLKPYINTTFVFI